MHGGCARWRLLRQGQCRAITHDRAGDRSLVKIKKQIRSLPSESAVKFSKANRIEKRRLVAYSRRFLTGVCSHVTSKIRDRVLVRESRGYQTCIHIKRKIKGKCYVRASWIDPRDKPCMHENLIFGKVTCVHIGSNLDSIGWRQCKIVTA